MLEERRNAYGNVVRKPLGKQSLINPRKVDVRKRAGFSWIRKIFISGLWHTLLHPSAFQLLCVSVSVYHQKIFVCM
jgi:hypothetical protein